MFAAYRNRRPREIFSAWRAAVLIDDSEPGVANLAAERITQNDERTRGKIVDARSTPANENFAHFASQSAIIRFHKF